MGFLTNKVAVATSDGIHIELLEPLLYQTTHGSTITVPAGFKSDGASIPQPLWSMVGCPVGPYWLAAIVHDYLYQRTELAKEYCDSILNEAMEALAVPTEQRLAIYEGVHFGGWKAFREDRSKETLKS